MLSYGGRLGHRNLQFCHGIPLAKSLRMLRITTLIFLGLMLAGAHADSVENELRNRANDLFGQLQKSVSPMRPFNHELTAQNRPKAGQYWIGIVGDSSTTGAAASPHFRATWLNLLDHLAEAIKNIKGADLEPDENLPAPLRVMYTPQEFAQESSQGRAIILNLQSDLSQKIDTEEYSFGYQVGRKLNLSVDSIVLAGQDGTRVSSMAEQFRRLLTAGPGTLPPVILVSYVANDLCGPENFSNPVETFRRSYKAELDRQFAAIATMPAAPGGTQILVVAPLDITNILTNQNLLSQKIHFEGRGEITCKDVRDGSVGNGDLAKRMQSTLIGECRGILAASDNPEQRLAQLQALQSAQDQALQDEIMDLNAKNLAIKAEYAESAKTIDFQPGDLANDCFHPSAQGAGRIADQLLGSEFRNNSSLLPR